MKTYLVTITTEERHYVEAASEDDALGKLNGLEPNATEIVDTSIEEEQA